MLVDEIARVAHGANRVLQALQNDPGVPVAPEWDDLPADEQESVLNGVEAAQAGKTLEQLHENWVELKDAEGWTWGPVKDREQMTHPCMVSYGLLPDHQKIKDRLFQAIVLALSPLPAWAGRDYETVTVSGDWTTQARQVELNGVPLRKVRNVEVREGVDQADPRFQVVAIELATRALTVLPTEEPADVVDEADE